MIANPEPKDTTDPTSAVDLDAMPIRERDAWVAATLRFMRDRGYTITAPGVVPAALVAARLERDALAEIVRRETEVPALLGEITRLADQVGSPSSGVIEMLVLTEALAAAKAEVERLQTDLTVTQVALNRAQGKEAAALAERRGAVDLYSEARHERDAAWAEVAALREAAKGSLAEADYLLRLQVGKEADYVPGAHAAHDWWRTCLPPALDRIRAVLAAAPGETECAVTTNPSMGVAMTPERLASLAAAEPCAACSGPVRRTVGMVCQVCGKDYAPSDRKPMTMPIPYADLIAQAQHGERLCVCGQPWSPDAEHRTNSPCLLATGTHR